MFSDPKDLAVKALFEKFQCDAGRLALDPCGPEEWPHLTAIKATGDGLFDWQKLTLGEIVDCLAEAGLLAEPQEKKPGLMFRLDLPWPRPPLRSNGSHGNHFAKAATVKDVRVAVMALAKNARIPAGKHLTVQLHYAPGQHTRMDSHNLHPTVKACVDALARGKRRDWVGLELVPDDTDEFVTILTPQIHYPPEPGPKCWLTVEVSR